MDYELIKRRFTRTFTAVMVSLGILIMGGYFFVRQLSNSILIGENNTEFRIKETKRLLDSSAVGLERFKLLHHHYPQCTGKYFLDSLKTFINISDIYVYNDSIDEKGKVLPIKKHGGKFNYNNLSHTYIGVGTPELTIIYRPLSLSSYKLYSVGENYLDEGGKGDDVLY